MGMPQNISSAFLIWASSCKTPLQAGVEQVSANSRLAEDLNAAQPDTHQASQPAEPLSDQGSLRAQPLLDELELSGESLAAAAAAAEAAQAPVADPLQAAGRKPRLTINAPLPHFMPSTVKRFKDALGLDQALELVKVSTAVEQSTAWT